jgi:FKBP-type peptidyl-prolyl cis-trans isomerase|eukprot:TRINITY_DN1084_c1_g1_i1.p2 TRINITY_DN1084_c1_g1~~TRINITY_DN1084_c1_g1_i1.p2  ORF type:complete len:445 (+),score=204.88 TRINITY_DN1084_c1_g1_i1:82-1416(+)
MSDDEGSRASTASPGVPMDDPDADVDDLEVSIDISPAGTTGVLFKTVHASGTGWQRPPNGCKVSVHYVGRLDADGTEFDSSRSRGKPFEFELGKGQVIRGWDVGVATMRVGERCTLRISPDFGYGAGGSPPKIPGNAWLAFEVELLSYSEETDVTYGKRQVFKKITHKSDADWHTPGDFTRCQVRYRVRGPDGEEWGESPGFADGGAAGDTVEFVLGEDQTFSGFETALCSMKRGERAELRIATEVMGPARRAERFSGVIPDDLAPGSMATAEIALVDFDAIKESWEMLAEEKCTMAREMKDCGNAAFKDGRLDTAIRRYEKGADILRSIDDMGDADRAVALDIKAVCNSNCAQVCLKKGDFKAAAAAADEALLAVPNHTKSLYRRAEARRALRDSASAVKDLEALLAVEPDNAAAQALLAHCKADIRKIEKNERKLYGKMFSS